MARSPLLIESCAPKVPAEENLLRIRERSGRSGKAPPGWKWDGRFLLSVFYYHEILPSWISLPFGVHHLHHNTFSFFTLLYVDPLRYGHQKG